MNRNFPSLFDAGTAPNLTDVPRQYADLKSMKTRDPLQPETKATMKWILIRPFVLSISFHGGALGSFYPYDDGPDAKNSISKTPDNMLLETIARQYASDHQEMHKGNACPNSKYQFPDGVSNGAEWYALSGSMTDFNYIFSNCFELTVELSCCKFPEDNQLELEWQKNKKSLINFLKNAHIGVKGIVQSSKGKRISGAEIRVTDNRKRVTTSTRGEYWRLLPPGKYQMQAVLPCDRKGTKDACVDEVSEASAVVEVNVPVGQRDTVIQNFTLAKVPAQEEIDDYNI